MGQVKLKIEGIEFFPLKIFENANGKLFHHVRSDSPYYEKFGEIYYSLTYPGVVKGWKLHREVSQIFTVPVGDMKFVFFDQRPQSKTYGQFDQIVIGEKNYGALKMAPGIWYAFTPIGKMQALIANQISQPHDPNESEQKPLDTFLKERQPNIWENEND